MVAFTDINCTPPPGQDCLDFLAEVQYLAGMPDRLSVLDDSLSARLADAFARHPSVNKIQRIAVQRPRQVEIQVDFRSQSRRSEVARR
jgi:hypothetical protein